MKRGFGELEHAVLNILKSGQRMTVKEVHHLLAEEDKYTTIMTVMSRLCEKGLLAREKMGAHYEYWLFPSKGKISSFVEKFKKKVFGIKTSEMVNFLIESSDEISDEEFVEMEKMLSIARAKRKS